MTNEAKPAQTACEPCRACYPHPRGCGCVCHRAPMRTPTRYEDADILVTAQPRYSLIDGRF